MPSGTCTFITDKADPVVCRAVRRVQICNDVVTRLKEIENRGKALNEAVSAIASAAAEQRSNIERFTNSVSELNEVTQGIAANVEESASAATE